MDNNELLQEKREAILQLAAKHGARNVRVFGSVARHEANDQLCPKASEMGRCAD
jgi:predicted nucleotidyltransferase